MTKKIVLFGLFLVLLTLTHTLLADSPSINFSTLTQLTSPAKSSASSHVDPQSTTHSCCETKDDDQ